MTGTADLFSGLTLDEQRPVQGQRDIYRVGEFWPRKVRESGLGRELRSLFARA